MTLKALKDIPADLPPFHHPDGIPAGEVFLAPSADGRQLIAGGYAEDVTPEDLRMPGLAQPL